MAGEPAHREARGRALQGLMDANEFDGKDLDDAIDAAVKALGRPASELDYEVLEGGRKGVFGLGARPVRIRVAGAVPYGAVPCPHRRRTRDGVRAGRGAERDSLEDDVRPSHRGRPPQRDDRADPRWSRPEAADRPGWRALDGAGVRPQSHGTPRMARRATGSLDVPRLPKRARRRAGRIGSRGGGPGHAFRSFHNGCTR